MRESEASFEMLRRPLVQIQIEQQATQRVVRHHLVAGQLQRFQPRQRVVQRGPGVAKPAERHLRMSPPDQRRPQVPLQVGRPRNIERGVEVRQGARVVAKPHLADAGPADHHQVLRLVAHVGDAACQLKRARKRTDRRLRLGIGEVRLATAMKSLDRHQLRQPQFFADVDRLLVVRDGQVVAAIAPGHCTQVIQRVGGMPVVTHAA